MNSSYQLRLTPWPSCGNEAPEFAREPLGNISSTSRAAAAHVSVKSMLPKYLL